MQVSGHLRNHQQPPSVHYLPVEAVLGQESWGEKEDSLWEVYHLKILNTELHLPSLVFYVFYILYCTADFCF